MTTTTPAKAAQHLRHEAQQLRAVTGPLDEASVIANHLGYDTSTRPARRQTFPSPTVHEGQTVIAPAATDPAASATPPGRPIGRDR